MSNYNNSEYLEAITGTGYDFQVSGDGEITHTDVVAFEATEETTFTTLKVDGSAHPAAGDTHPAGLYPVGLFKSATIEVATGKIKLIKKQID